MPDASQVLATRYAEYKSAHVRYEDPWDLELIARIKKDSTAEDHSKG